MKVATFFKVFMDTDNFSDMAYDIIVQAARISDTLKTELGAMSGQYPNEDGWLNGIRKRLQMIIKDPAEYVDYWNLKEAEGIHDKKRGISALLPGGCGSDHAGEPER